MLYYGVRGSLCPTSQSGELHRHNKAEFKWLDIDGIEFWSNLSSGSNSWGISLTA